MSAMISVRRYLFPSETARIIEEFVPRLLQWFEDNPARKICKTNWIDGRSIDIPRDGWREKIERELEIYHNPHLKQKRRRHQKI